MDSQLPHLSDKPKWMRDVQNLLGIRSQFILNGDVRDTVSFSLNNNVAFASLNGAIELLLNELGFQALIIWDIVDGVRLETVESESRKDIISSLGLLESRFHVTKTTKDLALLIRRISVPSKEMPYRVGLIVDYASRIADEGQYTGAIKELYVSAEKSANLAFPIPANKEEPTKLLYNPIFWIANRSGDLPFWFSIDNERIHHISIPLPDADLRCRVFRSLYSTLNEEIKDINAQEFGQLASSLTHGMQIRALQDIVTLFSQLNLKASEIDDAVLCYRVGDPCMDTPWRGEHLRQAIINGPSLLGERVKGQQKAVMKVLDVLKRTSIGLTGAQAKNLSGRPRGVLFFCGPTGVGKTELAKSISQLVFGNESAYLRFDMSEFTAEHSADRLIGAPPGYVGFDQGGELTNAIRENPFRVLLFDEIEKAHPRILDKFLQILEDGRLTDGQGETVFFSDALIIFTSNAGISKRNADGSVEYLVSQDDSQKEFEKKLLNGMKNYFHEELRRPELFNRIGENFIVFNFISEEVAEQILKAMIENVSKRLYSEHRFLLSLSGTAYQALLDQCTSDTSNGGRGIGAKLEDALINPLARSIFDSPPIKEQQEESSQASINITSIKEENGMFFLEHDYDYQ